jgi:hypothetical protein
MTYATSTSQQNSAAKWADYCISAVRYNAAHTHIDRVRAAPDHGTGLGAIAEYDRVTVVQAIKNGTTFVTVFRTADGDWRKGQPVYVIKVHGIEYIKTANNGQAVDNLDNLPEF